MARQIKVEVVGDASGFKSASAQVTGQASKMELVLQGVGQKVGQMGISVVTDAIAGLGHAIEDSIQTAKDDELAVVGLTQSLKDNVEGWDGNTAAVESYITSAEQASDFTKDELRTSLESLVGATHDLTDAEKLQSLAADLARYKHVSLADATDLVIKANEGVYKGLAVLGIRIPATTDHYKALADIQGVVAGQAADYAATAAGQQDALNNKLHDQQVEIGKKLLPAWQDLNEFAATELDSLATKVNSLGIDLASLQGKQLGVKLALETPLGRRTWIQDVKDQSQALIKGLSTDAIIALNTAKDDAVNAVGSYPRDIEQALVSGWDAIGGLNLTPKIESDSKRLRALYVDLAKVQANRILAIKAGDSVTVAADNLTIDQLIAEILALGGGAKGTPSKAKAMAGGGPVQAGVPLKVGDAGHAETFVPDVPGTILPNAGGIGASYHVHVHVDRGAFIDGPSIDRLTNAIAQRLRYSPGF